MTRRRRKTRSPVALISERRIRTRVRELGRTISRDYRGTVPVFIGILNGSFVFFADLIREVTLDCEVDFVRLSSYQGRRRGHIRLIHDPLLPVEGKELILVEDVVDSGKTLGCLKKRLARLRPKSIAVVALLHKNHRGAPAPDYTGFFIGGNLSPATGSISKGGCGTVGRSST